MEDLVLTGVSVPLTPWTVVNGDKLVPLLDRIRENLPEEVRQARMVLERRDETLVEAQRKATQLLQDAKEQAEMLLSESELLRAVHQEAERVRHQVMGELDALRRKVYEEADAVRAQTAEESRHVREGAEQYAETVLSSLEKSLSEFQSVVRNGQKHLKRSRVEALQGLSSSSSLGRGPLSPASSAPQQHFTPRSLDGLKPPKVEV